MLVTSINNLVESFENPTILLINNKPMYNTIHTLHKLLKSNTAYFHTKLVCSTLVHMFLTLSPTVYATLLAASVIPPTNPGAVLVILAGTTRPEEASIQYAHKEAMVAFEMSQNIDRALRQQLLGAVEDNFVRVPHMPHLSYSGSTILDLLTHLYATYAVITNANWILDENVPTRRTPPPTPSRSFGGKLTTELCTPASAPYCTQTIKSQTTPNSLFSTQSFSRCIVGSGTSRPGATKPCPISKCFLL